MAVQVGDPLSIRLALAGSVWHQTTENLRDGSTCSSTRGVNDFFTNPEISTDGKVCSIARIVLRAEGVRATTRTEVHAHSA